MNWCVNVAGYPVSVVGESARDHLEKVNSENARMKLALHRILSLDPAEWGGQGIYKAQKIARDGLSGGNRMTDAPHEAAGMTYVDLTIIRLFASGEDHLRAAAVAIHRQYIPTLGVRGTPEQRFMAEVDNPCPGLGLRATYRKALLDCEP